MRVRYEVLCGGRLLKITEQIAVSTLHERSRDGDDSAGSTVFVDGQHWWQLDEQTVAEDVAQAMIAKHAQPS